MERHPVIGIRKGEVKHPFSELGTISINSYLNEELFAGKARALITRGSPRDMYDAHLISGYLEHIDSKLFRKLAILYLVMHNGDARKLKSDRVRAITEKDISDKLLPMINKSESMDLHAIKTNAVVLADSILEYDDKERDFLDVFYEEKRIQPETIFSGYNIAPELQRHPSLLRRLDVMKGQESDQDIE